MLTMWPPCLVLYFYIHLGIDRRPSKTWYSAQWSLPQALFSVVSFWVTKSLVHLTDAHFVHDSRSCLCLLGVQPSLKL